MTNSGNLGQFITNQTEKYGQKAAFSVRSQAGPRTSVSFQEFNQTVFKISEFLSLKYGHSESAKFGGQFKIGLWSENRVEWCALALGIWHAGGILVPLMHIATKEEVKKIIEAAKLDAIFISEGINNSQNLKSQSIGVDSQNTFLMESLNDLLKNVNAPALPTKKNKSEDLAVLIFTSGTTGHPKGVMLTHGNLITNITDTKDVIPCHTNDRAVSVLPLSHMFELIAGFAIVHCTGITISYPQSLKSEDILNEMREAKATMMAAVPLLFEIMDRTIQERIRQMPTFVQNILKSAAPLVRKYPFLGKIIFKKVHEVFGGHIRYFFTGGAKIDPEVILRFQSLGIQMLQGYGLTETSPIISFTRVGSLKYKSVGKPLRSLQVKIHEPSVTGEGEIAVRGPSVFKGYFENPTATAEAFKDGWFHTGDLGFLDEEGYIFITGRKKDMIVTPNGKNVYPEELEELLKGSALFSEVSVLGLESGRGEAVHAVIVPVDLRSNHPKEKIWEEINRLTAGVSEYKKIQGVTVAFEELPKTPTKKVKKHLLRKMIQEGHFEKTNQGAALKNAMGSPLNANKENEKWLLEKLTEITKKTQIYKESDLKQDLGIDSLTFMEIISILEAQFRVQIPDGEFSKMILVSDLLKYTEEIHENQLPVTAQTESLSTHFDFRKNNTILMTFARLLIHGLIIRPILKIFFRFKVKDQEFINSGGSFILTPNHSSHFDLLAILSSIPLRKLKTTYAVAAEDYFFNTRLKSLFVRLVFNAIPFDRKARIEKGFTICEEILKAGGNLVIFPEGTRSPDGNLSAFKAGVGRLLAGHAYSAVPSYISGAFSILPKGGMIPKLHPLSIRFAKPVNFKQVSPDSKSYLLVAETLHHSVENLKDI